MVEGRENHSQISEEMITRLKNLNYLNFLSSEQINVLKVVIKNHQSKYDLSDLSKNEYFLEGRKINIIQLCSIFRFADSLHMGEDRVYKIVFNLIKEDLKQNAIEHWKANADIQSVIIDIDKKQIKVLVHDRNIAKYILDAFIKDYKKIKPYLPTILSDLAINIVVVEEESK